MWRVFMGTFAIAGLALLARSEGRAVKLGLASAMLILFAFSLAPGKIALAKRTRLLIVAAIPAAVVLIMLVPDLSKKMQLDRFSGAAPSEADGTAYWRLSWWQRLEKEVMTRNPAFGLGFGESLHLYHPALEKISDPWMLRAPHNFNVTVFTRMGIVGTIIWAGIILGGLAVLGRRIWRGRVKHGRYSPQRREELLFWMAMIAYTFVNSSFGVLMEGPVLGIWFWLALGFAYGRSERPDVPERQAALAELRRELKRFMNARGRLRTPSVPREEHAPLRAVPGGEF
jgi:O-antigen ligase